MNRTPLTGEKKHVLIERVKVHIRQALAEDWPIETDFEVLASQLAGTLVASLKAYIIAEPVGSTVTTETIQVPANWWQHLRETVLPEWWLSLHPVIYKARHVTCEWEERYLYPQLPLTLPKCGPRYKFVQYHPEHIAGETGPEIAEG